MNSRNPKTEAHELGKLKNPAIVCVWRHYDEPIPKWRKVLNKWGDRIGRPAQWKADLHGFALSFLPAVVAFMVTLAWNDNMGATFIAIIVLYAIMFITVALFKYRSTKGDNKVLDTKGDNKVLDGKGDNKVLDGIFLRIIGLVVVAFLLAAVGIILGILSGDPVIQGWVALIAAAVTAIFSQKFLALDPKYLVGAKKSPPLFSDREKRVWQKAAAVYGILVVAALPRLLPENILNIPWQVGVLFAGGAMLAGVILALFYWRFK